MGIASKLIGWQIDVKSEEQKKQEVLSVMESLTSSSTSLSELEGVSERIIVGVLVDAAATDVLPLISALYGLTRRERQLATLLLDGDETGGIARRMRISPHTVQQHLKSIFAKVGVRSRLEFVGRVVGGVAG